MFWPTLPSVASTIIRQISPSQVMLILSCLITDTLDHLIPAVFEGFTESDDLSMIGLVFDLGICGRRVNVDDATQWRTSPPPTEKKRNW